MIDLLAHNPTIVIYILQAFTYGLAAHVARHEGHGTLGGIYLASSALHGLLGVCHLAHAA